MGMDLPFIDEKEILDHGIVRLVDFMGRDLSIIRAARVSVDAAWRAGKNEESDRRLMRRLWRGKPEPEPPIAHSMDWKTPPLPELPKHSTPFEACTMTFEIMAPIFVFRQWHRHRTQSYNELSARYGELPEVYYLPTPEQVGFQDPHNKQGRMSFEDKTEMISQRTVEIAMVDQACKSMFKLYRNLLGEGWPRELARIVLPFGTYSHMFTTMNLLNFFKFANLRADSHAQYEIRVYAEAMLEMIRPLVPVAYDLFVEANQIAEL